MTYTADDEREGMRSRARVQPTVSASAADQDADMHDTAFPSYSRDAKQQKLCGQTPSGVLFPLPRTADMMSAVFGVFASQLSGKNHAAIIGQPRPNIFDYFTILVLATQIGIYFALPLPQICFLLSFLAWRAAYNIGLGILLKKQSDKRWLVQLINKYKLLSPDNPRAYNFLKLQIEKKMGTGYKFNSLPAEFNVWLLFRSLVDLILINDFGTYCIFFVAYWEFPSSFTLFTFMRIVAGSLMLLFNLWVKVDAHRVVKDFAWYWGDFFFLLHNTSLTFDGVFEMAPHPMYSVGYAGYYGVSLITGSYAVLYVSLLAHAAQFAFLTWVENPHIFKTYGKDQHLRHHFLSNPNLLSTFRNYFQRDMIVFKNLDVFRATDLFIIVITFYAIVAGCFGSRMFTVLQYVVWKIFHTYVLGGILHLQSHSKYWTKHFIRYGYSNKEAFDNWKSIYNLSLCMNYIAFFLAAFRNYNIPDDWTVETVLLRHVVGVILIVLHVWTSVSVYDVLGDFGWFYGDFFIDELPTQLFYTGIYRFLNNPEKIMGHAAFWGMTLISNSHLLFAVSIFAQFSNVIFLTYVERPHMKKMYGSQVRKESGMVKTFRSRLIGDILPDAIMHILEPEDIADTSDTDNTTPSIAESLVPKIEDMVHTTQSKIKDAKTRFATGIARSQSIHELNMTPTILSLYTVHLITPPLSPPNQKAGFPQYLLGTPLSVQFNAPADKHGKLDWIGLYRIHHSVSHSLLSGGFENNRIVNGSTKGETSILNKDRGRKRPSKIESKKLPGFTTVSSRGHWRYLFNSNDEYDADNWQPKREMVKELERITGTIEFAGYQLAWETGIYELRVHFNNGHTTVSVSEPFEIIVEYVPSIEASAGQFDVCNETHMQQVLLPLVRRCLDMDPASDRLSDDDDLFSMGQLAENYAKRLSEAISSTYGVDFSHKIIGDFGSVRHMAAKIDQARIELAPSSTSSAKSRSTSTASSSHKGSASPRRRLVM